MLSGRSRSLEIADKFIDLLLINIAWWMAYFIRFESQLIHAQAGLFTWYLKYSALITILNYYYFKSLGVYGKKSITTLAQDLLCVIKANTISFLIFIISVYFLSEHKLSRLFIITYYLISSILLISYKLGLRRYFRSQGKQGKHLKDCILIGNSHQAHEYAAKLKKHPEFGLKITKWFTTEDQLTNLNLAEIEALSPETIIFAVENKNYHLINNLLVDLNNSLVEIIVLPDLSHSLVGYQLVDIMEGTPAILINEPNIKSRSIIFKRVFDILSCSVGVVLISPLLILIAALVKLTSKGPILYGQVRMGLDGKEFKMWKFRSMTVGESNKEGWTVKDDPRVTKIGKFIRKTSLDELPQLFNVILGDMSLVGPRPERPVYVNQFRHSIPTYMLRHKMKAGITGWAQINGWRGDTSIEKRIECDLYYIRNWSIWMDLWIIVMTFYKGFINKNAY